MTDVTLIKKAKVNDIAVNEQKWGKSTTSAGWTLVPNILIERQMVGFNKTNSVYDNIVQCCKTNRLSQIQTPAD